MGLKDETAITLGILVITAFLLVNVDMTIGLVYTTFAILYMFLISSKSIPEIEIFSSRINIPKLLAFSAGGFLIWVLVANLVSNYFGSSFSIASFSIIDKIAQFTDIPVTTANPYLRIGIYGLMIPVIETMFLAVVIVFWNMVTKSHVTWDARNLKMYWVAILAGSILSLFHWKVRLSSDFALFVDLVFFALSALVIFNQRQLAEATGIHIFVNTAVAGKSIGWW